MGKQGVSTVLIAFIITGCAVSHTPSIMVMPHGNASYAQFQADEADCRQYAEAQSREAAQREARSNLGYTLISGLLGAALGASYGSAWGMSGYGARVGTTQGLASGLAHGAAKEEVVGQRAFDFTYAQCMRTKGHKLPGYQSIDDQPVRASVPDQPVNTSTVLPVAALPQAERQPMLPPQTPATLHQTEPTAPVKVVQLLLQYKGAPLFSAPDTESEKLGSVDAGIKLKALEESNAWVYIETPRGQQGWIMKDWLRK